MSVLSTLAKVEVVIEGLPPGLLMGNPEIMNYQAGNGEGGKSQKKGVRLTPEKEAELHAHWTKVGNKRVLALPWVNLYKCLCSGAGYFKWEGRRGKSMTELVAATVSCEQDMIPLQCDGYEVFLRPVRIPPRTGAMVRIGRPLIKEWKAALVLLVDAELYRPEMLEEMFTTAGKLIGLGPWRPSLKGPYGKFRVVSFKVKNQEK